MNPRTIILLVVALSAAALTAYFANSWMAAQRAAMDQTPVEQAPAIATVEVLVAVRNLPTGTFIREGDLEWRGWPEDSVVNDYLVKVDGAEAELVGAVARTPLFAGEPITRSRVVHKGDQGFLAAVLDPDHRAVSIPLDAVSGISGFIFPGDYVDVLLTFSTAVKGDEDQGSSTRYFSETVLNRVRVLAIDQTVDNAAAAAQVAKTATLEVSPKQAEKVAVAMEIGSLSLSLHSIALEEPALDRLTLKASLRTTQAAQATKAARSVARGSYTNETDVLSMYGARHGLPPPVGFDKAINLLRGDDAKQVRF